jgi:hypothetical protein
MGTPDAISQTALQETHVARDPLVIDLVMAHCKVSGSVCFHIQLVSWIQLRIQPWNADSDLATTTGKNVCQNLA